MLTERLRKIFNFKSNEIENKSNLSKETLDKISFIFKKLNNIYKLDLNKEYNCCGYVCTISTLRHDFITDVYYEYIFIVKLDNVNVNINISKNCDLISLYVNEKYYIIFRNNSFIIDNEIINKDEFVSFIETICVVIAHFYKDYSYILESENDYKYFEESAIKSREEARKEIVKFINNI